MFFRSICIFFLISLSTGNSRLFHVRRGGDAVWLAKRLCYGMSYEGPESPATGVLGWPYAAVDERQLSPGDCASSSVFTSIHHLLAPRSDIPKTGGNYWKAVSCRGGPMRPLCPVITITPHEADKAWRYKYIFIKKIQNQIYDIENICIQNCFHLVFDFVAFLSKFNRCVDTLCPESQLEEMCAVIPSNEEIQEVYSLLGIRT